MKKILEKIFKEGYGEIQLNPNTKLRYYTIDGLNNKVDKLVLEFKNTKGFVNIKSRNYEGIINEITKNIEEIYKYQIYKECNNVENGYILNYRIYRKNQERK